MVEEGKVLVREISTETVGQARLPGSCSVLITVHGVPAVPQEWLLATGSIVLGAGRGADLVVGDDSVSRKHLQISLSNQGIEVIDLNSSNGTYYQGQRIGRLTLDRGASFLLGRVKVSIVPQVRIDTSSESALTHYGELLGVSPAIRDLISKLRQLEQTTAPVLIEGEPGTGKELAAHEIHLHSRVRGGPFIAVGSLTGDPAAIRQQLFGAGEAKPGLLEQAHEGTLFFEELTELPLDLQPSILNALATGKLQRVGDSRERPLDVRVIAASRHSLASEVAAGRFAQQLQQHLSVVLLHIPPLRERPADIALLSQRFAAACGVLRLPPQVIEQLERYGWPGNVRELRNVIRAYAAVGELPRAPIENDDQLAEMLRRVLDVERPYQQQKDHVLNKFLDVYLSMLLDHTGGNQSQASRMSGIERAHLNRMIAKLRADSKRSPSGTLQATTSSPPPAGKRRNSSLPPRSK